MRKPTFILFLLLLSLNSYCQIDTDTYRSSITPNSITFSSPDGSISADFTSSNLPIILINTFGQSIPDEPKISAELKIIDNGPGIRNYVTDVPAYVGNSGIEKRGSSSQMFPKKSYGIETWDASGNDIDTSLLGMPSESDWILNANYSDKSFMRNVLAYQVWQNMGYYATRYKFVEVVLNNQYIGIYIFSEKIKRDKDRLDIAKLSPDQNTGDALTGGYIVKIDKTTGSGGSGWTSPYPPYHHPSGQTIFFQYEYPDEVDITTQQKTYIKNYVNSFETALSGLNFSDTTIGFRKYALENTFIDFFLVNEISKNVDGYRISTFFHKERDSKGGKIRMGPVWDFDIAWHNANYCGGDITSGWAYQFPCTDDYYQVPFWWNRLLQDALFRNRMNCRWLTLRQTILSNAWFDTYIDTMSAQLMEAQSRNFTKWPILGIYVWPNPAPYPATYQGEINALKTWIHNRMAWLDSNIFGVCDFTSTNGEIATSGVINIFPNPVSGLMKINYKSKIDSEARIDIFNQLGIPIYSTTIETGPANELNTSVDMTHFAPGVYITRLTINGNSIIKRFIKK